MTVHKMHFASLFDVVKYIRDTPATWQGHESSRKPSTDYSWDLGCNYQGALKLADLGWADGARNMAVGLERLRPNATATYRKYSVAGTRPSIGRYLSGNPRYMYSNKRNEASKPAVRIAVNICANAGARAEYMANYGLAIASYAEQLEKAGYPVEILAVLPDDLHTTKVQRAVYSWTVKDINARMNFSDVAFSIGHPACFRRLGFALLERTPCRYVSGHGSCTDIKVSDLPAGKGIYVPLDGINGVNRHSTTPEAALEHVAKVISEAIERQGA